MKKQYPVEVYHQALAGVLLFKLRESSEPNVTSHELERCLEEMLDAAEEGLSKGLELFRILREREGRTS